MDRFDWLELDQAAPQQQDARLAPPTDGPSSYKAARRMREGGHFRAAATLYEKATRFDEHFYAAWVEWVDTLLRANHLPEADQRSAEALDTYRRVRVFYASRALVLARQGRLADAYAHVDVALEQGGSWYARLVRAEILLRDSERNRGPALDLLVQAAREADAPWEGHFIAGLVLLEAGWPAQAAGFFSETVHIKPTAVVGLLCLGDCFRALRLFEQALFYYQKAVQVAPANELAMQRQLHCAPRLYGLTRVFRPEDLRKTWEKEFGRWAARKDDQLVDY